MEEYAVVLKASFTGETASHSEFNTQASLLLLLPPANFSKITPEDHGRVSPAHPSLKWEGSIGAVDYEYCFDTINNNRCDTTWTGTYWPSTYLTSVDLQALPANTTFYWQVRAKNLKGKETYANHGNWWSFTTCKVSSIVVTNTNDSRGRVVAPGDSGYMFRRYDHFCSLAFWTNDYTCFTIGAP